MYGLVNKAVQGLITKEFGEEKWNEIKTKAGFVACKSMMTVSPIIWLEPPVKY